MGYIKHNLTNSKPFKLLWLKSTNDKGVQGHPVWQCLCDCGTTVYVLSHLHKTQRTCGQCSKWCPDCTKYLSISGFPKNKAKRDGLHTSCSECSRKHSSEWRRDNPEKAKDHDLRKKTGISLEQKTYKLALQNGLCAVCKTDTPGGRYNVWHTDHDHRTGKFRGVLCAECNMSLGMVRDDANRLRCLADYIEFHSRI